MLPSNGARSRTLWGGFGIRLLSQEHTVEPSGEVRCAQAETKMRETG